MNPNMQGSINNMMGVMNPMPQMVNTNTNFMLNNNNQLVNTGLNNQTAHTINTQTYQPDNPNNQFSKTDNKPNTFDSLPQDKQQLAEMILSMVKKSNPQTLNTETKPPQSSGATDPRDPRVRKKK
jgi:hypothetical protein